MRFHSFMLSVLSIGWAMAGPEVTSASGQVLGRGNQAPGQYPAVMETRSQSNVLSTIRSGGLLGLARVRSQAPMMQTVYLNAASPGHVPAMPTATPTFLAPSPLQVAPVPAYSYHSPLPVTHLPIAPGSAPAVLILVITPSGSHTTVLEPGLSTHGHVLMSPQSSFPAQGPPAQWGPLPGPAFHQMGFAAPQAQQRLTSQ